MIAEDRGAVRRYATTAIVLHWVIAFAIVLQVMLAWRMGGPPTPRQFALIQLHKSVGVTILLLSLVRLAWRLAHRAPPLPADMPRLERRAAQAAHAALYVLMIGMPLTGWLMVSASPTQIPTRLYGRIPWPDVPGIAGLAGASKAVWRTIGETSHQTLAYGLYVVFALHVAGALKHQLFDVDRPLFARMAPGARSARWWEPRLIAVGLGLAAAAALGSWIQPPLALRSHATKPPPAAFAEPVAAVPSVAEAPLAAAAADPVKSASPTTSAGATAAATWRVEPSSVLGFLTNWGGEPIDGTFRRWRAEIRFGADDLAHSHVRVSIDLASADTGDEQRDASLASPDWFDAAAHPAAVFTASEFERAGADRFIAHGRISLRGVSRPLDLPFTLKINGDKASVVGQTELDRLAFGVGQGEFLATDQVPAKVKVTIKLAAVRQG